MKRIFAFTIVFILTASLFLTACSNKGISTAVPSETSKLTESTKDTVTVQSKTRVSGVRIVVDGNVHTFDALLADGDWYLLPADIKTALGVDAEPTLDGYANLRLAVQTANYSYEHDDVLNAAYIWTRESYGVASQEFNKAVSLGFVSNDYAKDADRQITAVEYRKILLAVIQKAAPEQAEWFEENVTNYDKPLLRGEGFVMAYFAAVCLGDDIRNNDFDNTKADSETFWDNSIYSFDALFPHVWDGPVTFSNDETNQWYNYYVAAFLWSFWYSSPDSGKQVFEFDLEKGSMRQDEPLTVLEAVNAAMRVLDGVAVSKAFAPVDSPDAIDMDRSIITSELIEQANTLPEIKAENIANLRGFVLSDGSYDCRDIQYGEGDLRLLANWGFKSVRLMVTYQTFFNKDATQADITMLKKLDAFLAAAVKYHIHVNLLTFSLPGRWTSFDLSTYETKGELDLFTNSNRQQEVNRIWSLFAERYKDVPSSILSFCPIWEAQNHSLSSGLSVPNYSDKNVADLYVQVIQTIKDHDPDRLVIFEPTANNNATDIMRESDTIRTAVTKKFPDAVMMSNFCEMPFVYAEMTAVAGDNVDMQNHSMFKPEYPTTIYAAQYHLDRDTPLIMNGALKTGTQIDLYLSKVTGNGTFTISADDVVLYSEKLTSKNYITDPPLSGYYPFAKSEKQISVTLPSDAKQMEIQYSGKSFEWCGINVTLSSKYAVQRWWYTSSYDALLTGVDEAKPSLVSTSVIMLCPNSYDIGNPITLHENVTYSSSEIIAQSNQQTIEDWAKTMSEYSLLLVVRFENAMFNIGCSHDSAMRYYNDLLAALTDMGWVGIAIITIQSFMEIGRSLQESNLSCIVMEWKLMQRC